MPGYSYKAINAEGATVSGQINADDELAALDGLAAQNLTPVHLKQGDHAGPWWSREVNLTGRTSSVPPAELERFFSTFAALMQAKLPLPRALRFCADQAKSRPMRSSLIAISDSIANGQSFGAAVQDHPNAFPARFATLLALGEKSNRLEEIAHRAVVAIRSETAAMRDVRSAMIYPIILLIMSVLVLSLVVFFLAPTLVPVFASSGAEPPAILSTMVRLRDLILGYWLPGLACLAAIILSTILFAKPIRSAADRLAMRLPGFGNYIRQRETLKFCRFLGLLLTSGAQLNEALSDMVNDTKRHEYRRLISDAESRIVAGGTLSDSIANSPLIDEMARALIVAGEESDQLPRMLNVAADALTLQSNEALNRAVRLLTPLLTLVIGLGVGAIILSTITAILDLNDVAF